MTADPIETQTESGRPADSNSGLMHANAALLVAKAIQLGATMGALVILMRRLTPADFGIAALALVVPEIVTTIHQFGIPSALMRHSVLSQNTVRRCLRVSARKNAWCLSVVVLGGALLAGIYDISELGLYALAMAPAVFLCGVSSVYRGILENQFRFGVVAVSQAGAPLVSAALAVAASFYFQSAFPLILQSASDLLVRAAFWLGYGVPAARRLPLRAQSDTEVFEDVTRFGRELTWSKVVRSAVNMLDRLVVGLITTPTGLGFYTAARRWSNLPVQEVHLATLHPSVAWLVRSGSNDMDFRSSVRMSTVFPMILAIPACAWLFLEAPTVVETVFGNAWLGVVPLFRVLLVAAVCRLPVMLMSQVYYSEGRSREQLRWTWFEAAVFSAAILLGALGDERTVAFAYAGISVALAPIGVYYAAQGSRAKFSDLIVPWCVIMTYSSVAFGCSAFGRDRLSGFGSDVIMALISAAIFLVAFFLLMLVTWSFSGLRKTVLGRHPLRVIWRENVSPPGGSESGGAVIQGDRTRN